MRSHNKNVYISVADSLNKLNSLENNFIDRLSSRTAKSTNNKVIIIIIIIILFIFNIIIIINIIQGFIER